MSTNIGKMFIGGEWIASQDGGTRDILNPANNEVIATVADGTERDAERAAAAARTAFDEGPWPTMPAAERAKIILKLADLIDANGDQLAELDTRNNGKPLREAKFDVADAANCLRSYAGLNTNPVGQTYHVTDPAISSRVLREPIGVSAAA